MFAETRSGDTNEATGTEHENKSKEHEDTMVKPVSCKDMEQFSTHGENNYHCRKDTFQLPVQQLFAHEAVQASPPPQVKRFSLASGWTWLCELSRAQHIAQCNGELTSNSQQIALLAYASSTIHKYKPEIGKLSSPLTSRIQNITQDTGYAYIADSQVFLIVHQYMYIK